MEERARELVGLLAGECDSLKDVQELLKELFKGTLEQMLESEMDEHLGCDKHSATGNESGNSRNGYNEKRIQSELGVTNIRVPRDRNGAFEPRVIGKS